MRPTREQIADRRAEALRFLAANPTHELAPILRVLVAGLAPPTKDEALHVLVRHANMAGDWASDVDDEQRAMEALSVKEPDELDGGWSGSIWAQYASIVHFMGGEE